MLLANQRSTYVYFGFAIMDVILLKECTDVSEINKTVKKK